jgi:hypothetical protein
MVAMGRTAGRAGQSRGSSRTGGATRRRAGSSSRGSGHARPARAPARRRGARVSWPRRLGLVGALLLLGASVVFAGQALQPQDPPATPIGGRPTDGAEPSPRSTPIATERPAFLPGAPVLRPVAATLVTVDEIELSGELIEDLPRDGRYRLRVYINGELVRDRRLPRRDAFTLPPVAINEGRNEISLAINGPAGESLHSAPVLVVRDTTPPVVTVLEPAGDPIYASATQIRGTSEPGATLQLTNRANRASASLVVGDDGRFESGLALAMGTNEIVLEARDAAGNVGRATLVVERRDGSTSATLSLSRNQFALTGLPATFTVRGRLLDPAGLPIDDAEVTFSVSPPGLPTQTYVGTTSGGVVTWSGVRISRDAQAGQGLVTMLVVLPDGATIQASDFFTIE